MHVPDRWWGRRPYRQPNASLPADVIENEDNQPETATVSPKDHCTLAFHRRAQ